MLAKRLAVPLPALLSDGAAAVVGVMKATDTGAAVRSLPGAVTLG